MKKLCILVLVMVLLLAGCKKEQPPAPTTQPVQQQVSTTLMVYMIGSDLEAKGGAGSNDLEEMLNSGVDLALHNVVVCAGGSKRWHNETMGESQAAYLELTEQGFTKVQDRNSASMGEGVRLTDFLQFAWENYPAERFALVLWDHGSGPVMGYGVDELFERDSLLLEEMRQGLQASPFGKENPLAWVGFDACLMASAELCSVWAEYADYLVASQEIEPSFGWNYAFLQDLGNPDIKMTMQAMTQAYLDGCLAYYQERGFDNRDTTLACVDLSYAKELDGAINALFAKAARDVENNYDALAVSRVETRAFGRATTGSEYDLIDLGDLAARMEKFYPGEAEAIQTVLEKMVVCNANNAQLCSGLSLYYPFYNKAFYEKSWQAVYNRLGVYPDYLAYLQGYEKIWLNSDKVASATGTIPQQQGVGQYTLALTKNQEKNFASARYYILRRDGDSRYTRLYIGNDVTLKDGILTANFDGNVLYAKNKFGVYTLPIVKEEDTVGGITRYSSYLRLTNSVRSGGVPEGEEHKVDDYRIAFTKDNTTGKTAVSALWPFHGDMDANILTGGKLDENLQGYHTYIFMEETDRYITRYDNGTVKPYDQWHKSTWISGMEWAIGDGLEFDFAPLPEGQYSLMFEVQDTQGNRFCSELLPIMVQSQPKQEKTPKPLVWNGEERTLLTEKDNVKIYLKKGRVNRKPMYQLEVENGNEFALDVRGYNIVVNDRYYVSDWISTSLEEVEPGKSWVSEGMDFGMAVDTGAVDKIRSLQIDLTVINTENGSSLLWEDPVRIEIPETAQIKAVGTGTDSSKIILPFMEARADEQVIFEDMDVKVTVLGAGRIDSSADLHVPVLVENLSDHVRCFQSKAIAVNRMTLTGGTPDTVKLLPGTAFYWDYTVTDYALKNANITAISNIDLLIRVSKEAKSFAGSYTEGWYPVELSQAGQTGTIFPEDAKVIFEENGIRIALIGTSKDSFDRLQWDIAIYNGSDQGINMRVVEDAVNGKLLDEYGDQFISMDAYEIGAGQYKLASVHVYSKEELELESVTFRIRFMTYDEGEILFDGKKITLTAP